jgi:hypothetical protein
MLWLLIGVGSIIGGLIPGIFHAGFTSVWSILGSAIGGLAGIWFYRRLDI